MDGSAHNDSSSIVDPAHWIDDYGDSLFAFAVARIGDRDLAEEMVQETFLAGLASIGSYRGQASMRTWLTGILRRKIADEFRRRRRSVSAEDSERQPSQQPAFFDKRGKWQQNPRDWRMGPQEILESQEFWEILDACVERLPPPLATAFRLKQLEGQQTRDVCEILQITDGNLSVRMHRARLSLRECLERNWCE